MRTIIAFQKANNDYDLLASNTKTVALQRGADPRSIDGELENRSHRSDFVEASMNKALGAQPLARRGQQTSGSSTVTSKGDYDALPHGAIYTFNGRTGTKP